MIMDVHKESETGNFLNNFVDQYNSIGHKGNFLSYDDIRLLKELKFVNINSKNVTCKWVFSNYQELFEYFINLFGLDMLSNMSALHEEIKKRFLIKKTRTHIILNWSLFLIRAHKL